MINSGVDLGCITRKTPIVVQIYLLFEVPVLYLGQYILNRLGFSSAILHGTVKERRRRGRHENVLIDKPPRDKTNNVAVRPANTQISLGIRPV